MTHDVIKARCVVWALTQTQPHLWFVKVPKYKGMIRDGLTMGKKTARSLVLDVMSLTSPCWSALDLPPHHPAHVSLEWRSWFTLPLGSSWHPLEGAGINAYSPEITTKWGWDSRRCYNVTTDGVDERFDPVSGWGVGSYHYDTNRTSTAIMDKSHWNISFMSTMSSWQYLPSPATCTRRVAFQWQLVIYCYTIHVWYRNWSSIVIPSMGLVHLPTFTIKNHQSCTVGKYTSPMDGMGIVLPNVWTLKGVCQASAAASATYSPPGCYQLPWRSEKAEQSSKVTRPTYFFSHFSWKSWFSGDTPILHWTMLIMFYGRKGTEKNVISSNKDSLCIGIPPNISKYQLSTYPCIPTWRSLVTQNHGETMDPSTKSEDRCKAKRKGSSSKNINFQGLRLLYRRKGHHPRCSNHLANLQDWTAVGSSLNVIKQVTQLPIEK